MILSITFKEVIYLFSVVNVRDDERGRQLYFISWESGAYVLMEFVPVIDQWLHVKGFILNDEYQAAVLAVAKKAVKKKRHLPTKLLPDILDLIATTYERVPEWSHQLPRSA